MTATGRRPDSHPVNVDKARRAAEARKYEIRGAHSAACIRKKHPDYAHGMTPDQGCVVDERGVRCECTARWREVRA